MTQIYTYWYLLVWAVSVEGSCVKETGYAEGGLEAVCKNTLSPRFLIGRREAAEWTDNGGVIAQQTGRQSEVQEWHGTLWYGIVRGRRPFEGIGNSTQCSWGECVHMLTENNHTREKKSVANIRKHNVWKWVQNDAMIVPYEHPFLDFIGQGRAFSLRNWKLCVLSCRAFVCLVVQFLRSGL